MFLTMKIVHISRCIARIMIKTCYHLSMMELRETTARGSFDLSQTKHVKHGGLEWRGIE